MTKGKKILLGAIVGSGLIALGIATLLGRRGAYEHDV